jgi:hypothetical protein
MAKGQEQDSIEHLWQVINDITRDMIAKSGGVQKIGVVRITDAVMRQVFALGAGSSEGERLGRAFVKAVVQAICAEAEVRQRFKEHPQDKLTYEAFWNTLS